MIAPNVGLSVSRQCTLLGIARSRSLWTAADLWARWRKLKAFCPDDRDHRRMYLVHFAFLATSLRMAEWIIPALDMRTMLFHFAFTLVGSFVLASVTYRYAEVPAIRWAAKHSRLRSPAKCQGMATGPSVVP
jgi:hypothetical protein